MGESTKAGAFCSHARGRQVLLFALVGSLATMGASARDEETPLSAVVGAVTRLRPHYSGSSQQGVSLRPLFAIRYGRFRLANAGASAVLSFGGEPTVAGASVDLVATDEVRLGVALRVDEGRRSSDSEQLEGLPEVRRTLRARFYGSIDLTPHWSVGATVSQDVLGRQGGALASFDIGYRRPWSASTQWSISAGVSAADRRYMRTSFGISEQSAAATGMSAYDPDGGLRDVHAGAGVITALTPQWIAFVNIGASSLLGEAAKSPLTRDRSSVSLSVGLAYRWKR